MDSRAVIRSYVKWTVAGSVLGMCLGAALRAVVFYSMRRHGLVHWAETWLLQVLSSPFATTLGALAASVQFGRKYGLSQRFHLRSLGLSLLGLAIANAFLFQLAYGLLIHLNRIPLVKPVLAVAILPGVLVLQFVLPQARKECDNLTLTPREIAFPLWVAPALGTISAVLGLLNPKLVESVLWSIGNPLPFGTDTILPSAFCAAVSAVTGTVALVILHKCGRKSAFKYGALVGAGISYPFLVYYSVRALALFYGLSQIH